jgi:hypothetical protein
VNMDNVCATGFVTLARDLDESCLYSTSESTFRLVHGYTGLHNTGYIARALFQRASDVLVFHMRFEETCA